MSFQKCQKCDRPATHKFTRIVDGQAVDFFFCQEHAAEFSPLQKKAAAAQMSLAQLLAGLLKEEQGQKADEEQSLKGELRCDRCGLTYKRYRKTMLLGCSDCYRAVAKQLAHDLRRYHGTVRHTGRQPERSAKAAPGGDDVAALEKRLAVAIEDEDFELAAQLRDQIRDLRSAGKKAQSSERKADGD